MKYLKNAAANNLALKHGGTKQTQQLYFRAAEAYDKWVKEGIFQLLLSPVKFCHLQTSI